MIILDKYLMDFLINKLHIIALDTETNLMHTLSLNPEEGNELFKVLVDQTPKEISDKFNDLNDIIDYGTKTKLNITDFINKYKDRKDLQMSDLARMFFI